MPVPARVANDASRDWHLHVVDDSVAVCGGSVAQIAMDAGGKLLFARYSRAEEREADSAAAGYLVAAGMDPRGVHAVGAAAGGPRRDPSALEAWFESHPAEAAHIARSRAL